MAAAWRKTLPLATALGQAGYSTNYIGKWHLAPGEGRPRDEVSGPVAPAHRGGFRDLWEASNQLEWTSHAYDGDLYDNDGKPIHFSGQNRVDFMTGRAQRCYRRYSNGRAGVPTQPLTSGLWKGDWSAPEKLSPMEKMQIELSDVISFHNYDAPEEFEKRVRWLQAYNRPILCTEYMARPNQSTFQGILPVAKKYKVAAYNWGFVAGKHRPTCLGIPGRNRTPTASRPCGSTTSFPSMGNPTGPRR